MSELLWSPQDESISYSNLSKFYSYIEEKYNTSFNSNYELLWKWSIQHKNDFWAALIEFLKIDFSGDINPTVSSHKFIYDHEFFPNIQINYTENILNKMNENPIIFINEKNFRIKVTKNELSQKVMRLSAYFRSIGVKKGDRIAAVAANTPNTVIAFLATNYLGAIWSSCSPDFGENAILDRFSQITPKVLLFSEVYLYGDKKINIKEKIKSVFKKINSAEHLLKINYPDSKQDELSNIKDLNSIFADEAINSHIPFEQCNFNDPMYILYSSGTTGRPKCIVHNIGGPLLQHMKEQQLHCDLKQNDKIFYYTTCGWMMWNWLISGIASGASIVLYDGSPFFPNKDSLFKMADTEQVDIFGISAKYIDSLRNDDVPIGKIYNLENLKCILSTGSPLSSDGFEYVYKKIKKNVHLASISGGTDIVSCFVGGNPMIPVYAGEIQSKCLGVEVDVVNNECESTEDKGELVCRSSIPSMPIGFWNDKNKINYKDSYFSQFNNIWSQGDYAQITKNNGVIIYGRSDATLNPGGIRIGTAEIYRVVEEFEAVEESIAVAQNWDNDVRIILFVKLNSNQIISQSLKSDITASIKNKLSRRHAPAHIVQINDIPKTRSGKIAELTIRDIINGVSAKNIDALANPECLKEYQHIAEIKN